MTVIPAAEPNRPLVAVICRLPILGAALSDALDSVADVHSFPAQRGDTAGLLRWLEPDGVVVDTDEEAAQAAAFASAHDLPVVHVAVRDRKLRVLRGGQWEEPADAGASPEGVRNVLVGGIFKRRKIQ